MTHQPWPYVDACRDQHVYVVFDKDLVITRYARRAIEGSCVSVIRLTLGARVADSGTHAQALDAAADGRRLEPRYFSGSHCRGLPRRAACVNMHPTARATVILGACLGWTRFFFII